MKQKNKPVSEKIFRTIIEQSAAAFAVLRGYKLIYVNERFAHMFGYNSPGEIQGRTIFGILTVPPFAEVTAKESAVKYNDNEPVSYELEAAVIRKDGTEISILAYISGIELPDGPAFVAFVADNTVRKTAETVLKQDEEQYRSLIENMQDTLYRTDAKGNVIFSSQSVTRLLGIPTVEFGLGMNLVDTFYLHPEDREVLLSKILKDGEVRDYEVALKRWDNREIVYVSTNSHFYHDKAGKILGVEGLLTDITERKKAEEALRASEEKYRTLVENIQDVVYRTDINGKIVFGSPSVVQLLGVPSAEAMIGLDTAKDFYYYPEERANFLNELKNHGEVRNYEVTLKRWDNGQPVPVSTNSHFYYDKDGTVLGVEGLFTDITERKKAEEALRASEAKYRNIYDNVAEGIFQTGFDGKLLNVNPSLAEMAGYESQEEMINKIKNIGELYPDIRTRDSILKQLIENGLIRGYELQFYRKGREKAWTILNAHVVKNEEGKPLFIEGTIYDISARKKMEEENKHLQEMLLHSQKIESIGRLAGGIAHDFNNLLTAILGNTEMAMNCLDPDEKAYSRIVTVRKAAEAAANLTRQLLAFSRKQILEPKILNLNQTIDHVNKMIVTLIGENIKFVTVPQEDLFTIKADPGQVEQIIINLAANARDAMPDGGTLTIETMNVYLDEHYSRTHEGISPGDYVMMSISDTGMGMDKTVFEHLFEPFYTTKERGRGTGLGLATVYGIVKQNEGSIEVYSEVNRGTSFKIYFPSAAREEISASEETERMDMPTGSETILIVEDKVQVLEFCRDVLLQLGYSVLLAESGEEALDVSLNCRDRIDLLMTDIVLPGINGRETAEKIAIARPGIKILYNSGYTGEAIDKHGILEPGINFIGKPFTGQALAVKVRQVLDKS